MLFRPKALGTLPLTAVMAGATLADRVIALIFSVLIPRFFGVNAGTDAYFVALFLPVTISTVVVDVTYVTILNVLGKRAKQEAHVQSSDTLQLVLVSAIALGLIALLLVVLSKPLIVVQAPAFDSETTKFAARLLAYSSSLALFMGLGGVLSNVLISRHYALLGVMRLPLASLLALGAALGLIHFHGMGVEAFLFGMIVGHGITFCIAALASWPLLKEAKSYKLNLRNAAIKEFASASVVTAGVNVAYYVMVVVERIVASFLFPGAITLLNMARMFVPMLGAIHGAFSNAFYRKLVSSVEETLGQLALRLQQVLKASALMGVPIVIVAYLCYSEINLLLFGTKNLGGNKQLLDEMSVAIISGFPHILILGTFLRLFQSLSRWRQVLYYFCAAIVGYLALALALTAWLGALGLAVAYSVTLNGVTIAMYVHLRRLSGNGAPMGGEGFSTCISAIAAFAAAALLVRSLEGTFIPIVVIISASAATFVVFLACAWTFKLSYARRLIPLRRTAEDGNSAGEHKAIR